MVSILTDHQPILERDDEHTVIEIDRAALRHNLQLIRSASGGAGVIAVVKADAYGHGAVETARALEEGVEAFAVNRMEEGAELRKAGIERPILVFEVPEERYSPLITAHELTATVSALQHLEVLPEGARCHLNFDTGMGRLGLREEQLPQVRAALEARADLRCTGLYSHFATAEDPGSSMAEKQLEQFKRIRGSFGEKLTAHMAHTGGLFFYPAAHFDLVRPGIGLYGYAPGTTAIEGLRPALRWKTRLVQVHPVKEGDTVSYGAEWTAPAGGYVGVLPVGYDDGLRRALSGHMEVGIGGRRYKQVGRITMNYTMVFLGEEELPEGTEVVLLDGEGLHLGRWAEQLDAIPYELCTSLSKALPRRYI